MKNKTTKLVDYDTVCQISTFGAIIEGCLDGFMTLEDCMQFGDFGIGTITGLDGEILILNNKTYYFAEDGHTKPIKADAMIPRMTIAFFNPERTISLNDCKSYKELENIFEASIPTKNIVYAIKITGHFNMVKTKCFPKQQKPYPRGGLDLAAAIKITTMKNIDGTMIGFFTTEHFKEISYLKYHFHFICSDEKRGGHVMDLEIDQANMEINRKHNMRVILPNTDDFYKADLSGAMKKFHDTIDKIKDEHSIK